MAGLALISDDTNVPLGAGLMLAGATLGPSAGYFYGRCGGRSASGFALRALALPVCVSALMVNIDIFGPDRSPTELAVWNSVAAVSGTVYLTSLIYDIAAVRGAVRERNVEGTRRAIHVQPGVGISANGPVAMINVRF